MIPSSGLTPSGKLRAVQPGFVHVRATDGRQDHAREQRHGEREGNVTAHVHEAGTTK